VLVVCRESLEADGNLDLGDGVISDVHERTGVRNAFPPDTGGGLGKLSERGFDQGLDLKTG
jgi:hypothetical protein